MICVRDIQNEVIRFIDKGQNLYKNLLILTLIEKSNYVILNVRRTYIWDTLEYPTNKLSYSFPKELKIFAFMIRFIDVDWIFIKFC
jgi:hypothetical protein